MKLRRNIYVAVTGIVACSLILVSLAEVGTWADWRFSGYVPVCGVIGAVGVIWLGWYWLKLAGGITSIATLLSSQQLPSVKAGGVGVVNELSEAINKQFVDFSGHKLVLEKQVKDLQIQVQLAQRQRRNIEAIIYSIRDAVVVVDEFDRLLMANEAACRLLGFDFRSSQHGPISGLIDANKGAFVDFLRQGRLSKVRATKREIRFSEDGRCFFGDCPAGTAAKIFDCIVSCVYDDNKQVCGVVAVLHDITREKEVSQMKNDFVTHVSHELKTPLASIVAYSEMLVDGEADNERTRKEFHLMIQSQAKRLNRLIEDILNIARIESGLVKVDKKPISLTLLIEEQLQMIRSWAEEKNISLSWGAKGQKAIVFDQVYLDKDMMLQVIVNLLSNAVKYTPFGGSIRIETEVDESEGLARVSVTDTGVGIPENELDHVFDKFYRVSRKANQDQAKGTGLGLNLVKQIVEKVHNGRVFVRSEVGVGSTFGFELPLNREACLLSTFGEV